ncbi:hypothetical protein SAAL107622_03730 [Lacicoccus alkaliphilus]
MTVGTEEKVSRVMWIHHLRLSPVLGLFLLKFIKS